MKKNIILFVGKYISGISKSLEAYEEKTGEKFKTALLHDNKKTPKKLDMVDILISCKTKSVNSIQKALLPHRDSFIAVTCRGEDQIQNFAKVIPNLPYLKTPTSESLLWSSDKLLMRKRLHTHNKKITPTYTIVKDYEEKTINKIAKKVGFPLIVKPTGLAGSRLVTMCFDKEELKKTLKKVFKKIKKVHKESGGNWEPKVLVEQFLEGSMYSIDAYVDNKGKTYFCPLVRVTTGKEIGGDDFFGYKQTTPVKLKSATIEGARYVAVQAVEALGLKNTTAHIEMMRNEDGWKIIEVGARIGGFRHDLYQMTANIDHNMNDILIHMGKKPIIPKKIKGYATAMKFFTPKEGELVKVFGLRKANKLESFKKINIRKKPGDKCLFARNGGISIFNIILFNKERSQLLADVRKLEKAIRIEIK
ncbi:MAG: ATP-grasp domain-containing protein [Candidatus Magasanikbacteria bacterium]|nr:ATP-grasp domain-containing protein [Candidatus Magasanikbacteria bacterium]